MQSASTCLDGLDSYSTGLTGKALTAPRQRPRQRGSTGRASTERSTGRSSPRQRRRQPPGLKSGSSAHAIRPYRFALTVWCRFQRLPKPPSPRLPTTTQSRSTIGGHHRSRHTTDHSVLPSRHDARRCGCPAAPNHPGRALWRKAGKSLHPSKEPPTPPKEPLYPPPKSTNPLVVRCVPPCSPWAHLTARPCPACPCPPCALRRRPDRA